MNNFNQEATQEQVNNLRASFCPFGWLDLQAAASQAINAGHTEHWVSEQIEEWMESTDTSKLSDIDPVYVTMDAIMQEARNEIEEVCELDICNDLTGFDIFGNYLDSHFDAYLKDEEIEKLKDALRKNEVDISELTTGTQYYLSEIGITIESINA